MVTKKINELTELTLPDNADLLVIDDVSATETKKITFQNISSNVTNTLSQSLSQSITSLSQSVSSSFAAEASARTTAINSAVSGLASQTYVNQKISDLVNSAPATLDTLNELALALGSDANFSTTITNQIASYSGSLANAITALSGNVTASFASEVSARTTAINSAVAGLASQTYVNNSITTLSQSVTSSFAAEASARISAINSAVSGLATQVYVDNLVSGSANFTRSWFGQSSGSQSGNNTYKKLLDVPFYVTSSTSNFVIQSSWCASSATTQMFGYYVTIDDRTITASYNGNLSKNAAMTLFAMPIANGAAEGTGFIVTSSLSVGWHTASIYGKSQVDAWSTSMADTNAVWTTGYFLGARLLVTEESK